MIRFLNMLALIAVIGSATWAYSVKYETILVAEKLKKREAELTRERDAVAILQAEWHLFNRPERMQSLAKPEAGMQPTSAKQIVRAADVPQAMPEGSNTLDALLTGSILTPDGARKNLASKNTPKSTGATPAAVPASTTGAARSTVKTVSAKASSAKANSTKANQPLALRANAQPRLVPPARIGAATAETAAAPPPQASSPLAGFLKRLIQ